MQPKTIKAIVGIAAVTLVATAYFVWGCDQGSLYPLIGAILILAGKEVGEALWMQRGE